MLHNSAPLLTPPVEQEMDAKLAMLMVSAIGRDPSLLDRDPSLVQVIAAHQAASLELDRLFAARKKIAFRFQTARAQFAAHAAAA
jgi:hypothetical protein